MKVKKEFKKYKNIYILWFLGMILSVLLAFNGVSIMHNELGKLEEEIYNKVKKIEFTNGDIESYINEIKKSTFEKDILILYDYKYNKVIFSENVVHNKSYKKQINKEIVINDRKIFVDKYSLENYKLIHGIDLEIENIYVIDFFNGYKLYYIPFRLIWKNHLVEFLLKGLGLSCFFTAIVVAIYGVICKRKERKIPL